VRRETDSTVALDQASDRYVKPDVAAQLVGRSERTIRNWRAAGLLRSRVVDGDIYVDLDDVLDHNRDRPRRRRTRATRARGA